MAALESSAEAPAASQGCSREAGRTDVQAALPEQQSGKRLDSDEHSAASESHSAKGAPTGDGRGTSPAMASAEGCLETQSSICNMEIAKDSASCGNTEQQDADHGKQEAPHHKEPKVASKPEKKPARNRPCPCGSGRRYKECCGPVRAAHKRREANGPEPPEQIHSQGHVMAELYV